MLRRIEVRTGGEWVGVFRRTYWINGPMHQLFDATPAPYARWGENFVKASEILDGSSFYYTERGWSELWPILKKLFKHMYKIGVKFRVVYQNERHGMRVPYQDEMQEAIAA